MQSALLELYRHMAWATLRLIEHCQGLADGDLDATIPGTYGTIRATLRHLVDAEEGYLTHLAGDRPGERLPEGPVPLSALTRRVRLMGPAWERVAADSGLPDREITSPDGWRMVARVPMAQAIHHHRTQVLSILGARGLEFPRLDVWEFALHTGLMRGAASAGP